jgi:hypothetical protein
MPSKLDPHVVTIENWIAEEPQLTAIAIVGRLSEKHPDQFGRRQHSIVQRLLKVLRKKASGKLLAQCRGRCSSAWGWPARAIEGPTRPQPVSSNALRNLRVARMSDWRFQWRHLVTFSDEAIRTVASRRKGMWMADYEADLDRRIEDLHARVHCAFQAIVITDSKAS